MDRPRDWHTKKSKSTRERQILYDIMWNIKMVQMNLFTKQTHVVNQRGKEGRGINEEFGTNRYTLLYIKDIQQGSTIK